MKQISRAATTVLIALAPGMIVSTQARQFPYREASPYRTAFVESATKACVRSNLQEPDNVSVPKAAIERFCDCKVAVIATFVTAKDLEEASRGGMQATPRTRALEQQAEEACVKAFGRN